HLAYASVNSGRYDRARRYLGLASRLRDATSEAEALFFLYFGFAYYRFATGRLSPAVASIHRAGAFLKKSGPSYPVAIWSELRGRLAVLTGDVEAGLGHLAAAADYFTSLGREDLAQICETARALYAARYLLRAKEGRAVLRQCLTRLS